MLPMTCGATPGVESKVEMKTRAITAASLRRSLAIVVLMAMAGVYGVEVYGEEKSIMMGCYRGA